LAGESDEAQPQTIDDRLFRFRVDSHPNRSRVKRKKAMKPDCGLKANDAFGYALTREHLSGAQSLRKNLYGRRAHAQSSKGLHAGEPCLLLLDGFRTDTDLLLAQQSSSRQSKPSASFDTCASSR
jgi:hypothetical protein